MNPKTLKNIKTFNVYGSFGILLFSLLVGNWLAVGGWLLAWFALWADAYE